MKATTWSSAIFLALTLIACGSGAPATQDAAANGTGQQAALPPVAQEIELPSGTIVAVRLNRALSTDGDKSGDTFGAILDKPVVIDGVDVVPTGTKFTGHVTESDASGRLKGRAVLAVTLDAFDVNGRHYPIETSSQSRVSEAHKKRNIEFIGGGTGVGALIGGLTGGGKGALIGAGVGAAAGTGVAAGTGKKDVGVAAETVLRFSLKSPVKVQRVSPAT